MADQYGLYAIMLGCFLSGCITGLIGAIATVYFEDLMMARMGREKNDAVE